MTLKINLKPLTIFAKIRILYASPGCELAFHAYISNI